MQEVGNKPVVSVIIPTYNRAHLIGRAIRSVLNQTYTDFELIVVDDASADNTEEVVKNIKDPRIRYIQHKINKGGAATRNTGIKASKGKFIAFQDSDDEWLLEKLEKQMRFFNIVSDDVGVIYCGFLRWDGKSAAYIPSSKIIVKEGDISKQILYGNFVSTQTLLIRKECLEQSGLFDEQLPRLQDWDLIIRLSKICHFHLIDEPLVMVYVMPDSISNNNDAWVKANEIILEKHYEILKQSPLIFSQFLYYIGHLNCLHQSMHRGRLFFSRSLHIRPWYTKAWIAMFLSLFGQSFYRTVYRKRALWVENKTA